MASKLKKPNPKDYYTEADYKRAVKRYNRTVKNTKGVENAGSSFIKSVKDAWASRNNPRKPMVRKKSLTNKPKGEKGAWMNKGEKTAKPLKTWENAYGVGGTKPAANKRTSKPKTPKTTTSKPKTTSNSSTTVSSKRQSPNPVPTKQPNSKDMDANFRAWAKANPTLAKKLLEKGDKKQAGYKAVKNAANLKIKGTKKIGETQSQFLKRVLKTPDKKTWLQRNFKS